VSEPDLAKTHVVSEDNPWSEKIPDHGGRVETKAFGQAKATLHKIISLVLKGFPFYAVQPGPGNVQAHHGGSIWLLDEVGWFLVLNMAGIEYSGQFLSDPRLVDELRQNAQRTVAAFPKTLPGLAALGYPDAKRILETPVVDAKTISDFVDSIWNSCVPLPAGYHTGQLSVKAQFAGQHHYPKAVTDLQHVKWADFAMWVVDPGSGLPAAVAPIAPRGSGVATVKVEYAMPGTALSAAHMAARAKGKALLLPPDHPIAQQAFAAQGK
jgi:hypothetical protein